MAEFVNILENKEQRSDVLWVSRYLNFAKAYITTDRKAHSHEEIVQDVLQSDLLKAIEELELDTPLADLARLHEGVRKILAEIGYTRSIPTIRWLALIVVKIIHKTLDGIYVNEAHLMKIKASMGDSPYVLVPTHRSYGDFILMAFICFYYEIEIPCVAAGIDFLSMWLMGEVLRKTKAFFIRRTFQNEKLYKLIFSQYVASLVSQGDSPIEFFIEGTRSRTGKSLKPKYGFLSMVLKPYLDGDVPDIKIVPVSISYDRFLEEWLFARELLGTPKPKESTKGLLKVFSILNRNYGNVYFNFGEPMSMRDWIARDVDSITFRPITQSIKSLASRIIKEHFKLQVIGGFNLVSLVMYENLVCHNMFEMPLKLATARIELLLTALRAMGLTVLFTKGNVLQEIHYACSINPELMVVDGANLKFVGKYQQSIRLVSESQTKSTNVEIGKELDPNKLVLLVVYSNPVVMSLFYPALLLALIATENPAHIFTQFIFLTELFENEFPIGCGHTYKEANFDTCMKFLFELDCVSVASDERCVALSPNYQFIDLFNAIIRPYLAGYLLVTQYLAQITAPTSKKILLVDCQDHLKDIIHVHEPALAPIICAKTFITHCLAALEQTGCLDKETSVGLSDVTYSMNAEKLAFTTSLLDTLRNQLRTGSALKNKL